MNICGIIAALIVLATEVKTDNGAYTSFVNLEKLYTLEDELVTISDVILNTEKGIHGPYDVHGIYNISSTIETVKEIHRDIVAARNLTTYLIHPINIYHMVKRLSRDWHKVIATLEQSKSCSKVMKLKIDNMSENIPTGKHLQLIVKAILRMQAFYNISALDVTSGSLYDIPSVAPLSLDDAFDFARVAYEVDQCSMAVDWLKFVTSHYDKETASFNITNAMNLMSSAYLKLEQPRAALSVLDDLLKIDPSNIVAKRNIKYIISKMDEGLVDVDTTGAIIETKKERILRKYCSENEKMYSTKKNMFCTFTRERHRHGFFDRPTIKTEVLSIRPLIVIYRDITNSSEQKAVAYLGYEKMRKLLFQSRYTYPNGIDGLNIEDKTYWRWIPKLQKQLEDIEVSYIPPVHSHFLAKNIGLEGYENKPLTRFEKHLLGTYFVFLTEPAHKGGDIVFPFTNVRITPEKGSVLFFERTATKQMSICPVLADTEWIGVYPLQGRMNNDMCYLDTLIRPRK